MNNWIYEDAKAEWDRTEKQRGADQSSHAGGAKASVSDGGLDQTAFLQVLGGKQNSES